MYRLVLWLLLSVLLAGCESLSVLQNSAASEERALGTGFVLSGRIGVTLEGRGFHGNLRWRHGTAGDEALISSPLGQAVARIDVDAQGARLVSADGQRLEAPDAEALTEKALGWTLPLAGLPHWSRGNPVPGRAFRTLSDAEFTQDGWNVSLERTADGTPQRIELRRDNLSVRLAIDRWENMP
jgi:outer membrane lipoprotein LolB